MQGVSVTGETQGYGLSVEQNSIHHGLHGLQQHAGSNRHRLQRNSRCQKLDRGFLFLPSALPALQKLQDPLGILPVLPLHLATDLQINRYLAGKIQKQADSCAWKQSRSSFGHDSCYRDPPQVPAR